MITNKNIIPNKRYGVLLALAVLVVAMIGVAIYSANYLNPDVNNLDPAKLSSVKEAYLQEKQADGHADNTTLDDVYIVEYYGTYRECVVVMLTDRNTWYTCMIEEETVAGITIVYSDSNKIKVYKDGSLYSLQEAYDAGYLTKANIKRIKNIHNFPDKEFP